MLCATGLLLLAGTGLGLALTAPSAPAQTAAQDGFLDRTIAHLQRAQNKDGGFPMTIGRQSDPEVASAWAAIAMAAAGVNPREQFRPDGYRDVHSYIALHAHKLRYTTDFERVLLVVVAAGTDPHSFGGVDLVARILERQRDDGAFDREPGRPSSPVNTTIFAILSLSLVEEPAVDAAIARAADWLIDAQNGDSGWPAMLVGGTSSTDMTGAALQALHAAGVLDGPTGSERTVKATQARDDALSWLRSMQQADGGFPQAADLAGTNSASSAWVTQGLWAVGEDPSTWAPGGRSVLDFLVSLQKEDGSLLWMANADSNPVFMTAYTAPAYSGRYLPIAPVPYTGRVPDPRNAPPPETGPETPGVGGGNGGVPDNSADGGGVQAGGGGAGAPNFSRPKQGSKGRTLGGVRRVHPSRVPEPVGRMQSRTQAEEDRDRQTAAGPLSRARRRGGGATVETRADAERGGRRGNTGASGDEGGARERQAETDGGGEDVRGVVVGGPSGAAGVEQDDRAAAFGLRGASAGGDTGPWVATGIGGALFLCAGLGSLLERRRPELVA